MEGIIKINDAISYIIRNKGTKPSQHELDRLTELGFTSIYPIATKDPQIVNSWLKHIKNIDVDFSSQMILFLINYNHLPKISPPIEDDLDNLIEESLNDGYLK